MDSLLRKFLLFLLLISTTEAKDSFTFLKEKNGLIHWLRLLHIDEESRVDNPGFFFHVKGHQDPALELESTIKAFEAGQPLVGPLKQHPICAFPERYRFLSSLGLTDVKKIECKDFEDWKKGLNPASITLIFSSSFPNNPASIFGHTFFRLNQVGKNNDLLDYTVSYSADTHGIDEGFLYAYNGVFGGFEGRFSFSPYYQKVDEYSNSESRDIYEYELNIKPHELDKIINHIWELYAGANFDYWFFTENCSYMLGAVLEIGNDNWVFIQKNKLYYLPADLVRQIEETKDLVKEVKFRPSIKRKLEYSYKNLSKDKKKLFKNLVKNPSSVKDISDEKVLDTLIYYYDFRKYRKRGKIGDSEKKNYYDVLSKRALLPKSQIETIEWERFNQPGLGHDPQRILLEGLYRQEQWIGEINFKLGYHDLLNADLGYEPYSKFDVAEIGVQFKEEQGIDLSQIKFIDVLSLHPLTFYDPRFSWQGGVIHNYLIENEVLDHKKWQIFYGLGGAYAWNGMLYSILGAEIQLAKHIDDSIRFGPYGEWGYIFDGLVKSKITLKQRIFYNALSEFPKNYLVENELGYGYTLSKNREIRLLGACVDTNKYFSLEKYSLKVGYAYYF